MLLFDGWVVVSVVRGRRWIGQIAVGVGDEGGKRTSLHFLRALPRGIDDSGWYDARRFDRRKAFDKLGEMKDSQVLKGNIK